MKKKIFVLILWIVIFTSCTKNSFIMRLQELEEGVSRPSTEQELKEAVKKYQRRISDIMIAEGRVGIWYKILGSRYMDKKMYVKALECFKAALEYYPENQNLFYQTGLAASLTAKNYLDFDLTGDDSVRMKYYDLAVSSYKRALEIAPNYTKAAYGLSVLYVYELNMPQEAIPILEKVVSENKKPFDEMFLLASAYYVVGEREKAVKVYENIVEISGSAKQKAAAKRNIELIKGQP